MKTVSTLITDNNTRRGLRLTREATVPAGLMEHFELAVRLSAQSLREGKPDNALLLLETVLIGSE